MQKFAPLAISAFALSALLAPAAYSQPASTGASAAEIDRNAKGALETLYGHDPRARELAARSTAILVFPRVIKAGLLVGGQTGDGALIEKGRAVAFYNIAAGSFGLQAGVQSFAYALFFITPQSLDYLRKSDGWAVGTGPSVVVVDQGVAKAITSTTITQDVYAVPFGQHGLMAGVGIEGSKITQIYPDP